MKTNASGFLIALIAAGWMLSASDARANQTFSLMTGWKTLKTNGDPSTTGRGATIGILGEYLSAGGKKGGSYAGSMIESGIFYSHRDYAVGGTDLVPYGWAWTALCGAQFHFGAMLSLGVGVYGTYTDGYLPANLDRGQPDALRFVDRLEAGLYVNGKFELFPLSPYGVTLNGRYYNSALSSIYIGAARIENVEWTAGIRFGRTE